MPKTLKILPKRQNFAESGHTACCPVGSGSLWVQCLRSVYSKKTLLRQKSAKVYLVQKYLTLKSRFLENISKSNYLSM